MGDRRRARRTFVCLSSQRWSDPMWTNKQHIMSRLAPDRVIYVDYGPGGASGTEALIGAATRSFRVRESDGVTVLDLPMPRVVGRVRHGWGLRAALDFDWRLGALERWLRAERIDDAVVWVYHPGYGARVASLPHRLVVYDCVDDYTTFPEFAAPRARAWIAARERALCDVADVVICTSAPLLELKQRGAGGRAQLVPNVGDAAHFAKARAPDTMMAPELAALPRPVVGFIGAVSAYKVDVGWLVHLARAHPEWSLALVGPTGVADRDGDLSALAGEPNVHLLGARPYGDLPSYLKGMDVAVIPYRQGGSTRAVFPIKFFELLASGKPVVISDLPSLAEHFDAVHVARTADEFVRACEMALAHDDDASRARRIALAEANTWEHRVARLRAIIDAATTSAEHI